MTATPDQRARTLGFFDAISGWLRPAVASLANDPDAAIAAGRERFDAMLDELPYLDRPDHSMAPSMFACAGMLAVYEVLREDAVDAHGFGRAIHALPAVAPPGDDASQERSRQEGLASQNSAAPNEFVFEMIDAGDEVDSAMNVTSCAICHLFGKHDAMDLVPYMCAFDDVVSVAGDQGLRRTGTIALGASHCDFRFKTGGDPLALAGQYPDRIRLRD